MDRLTAERFVKNLYRHILEREPGDKEFNEWVDVACDKACEAIFDSFINCKEYVERKKTKSHFPNGHYYSAIVDPEFATNYFAASSAADQDDIRGINLDSVGMLHIWKSSLDFIQSTPFTESPTPANRFYYDNSNYPYGDAIILRAMIGRYKPRRIIEIGSGFSSACMLDAAEHASLKTMKFTCIDPDTKRLRSVLKSQDLDQVEILDTVVQDVPLELFADLKCNDILFIDSSHVLKTGSDVNHEIFSILPRLNRGVLIHFHDIQFPFEYPAGWVLEKNYSWNEIYAVRAFLMYNSEFDIVFWNGFFARQYKNEIETDFSLFLRNPGGSLWVERK